MTATDWVIAGFVYLGVGFFYRLVTSETGYAGDVKFDDFDASAAGVALILVWPVACLRRTARWLGRNSPKVAKWIWLTVANSVAFAMDPDDE